MQASRDILLGWPQVDPDLDGKRRDFYVGQLRDWKGSAAIEQMVPSGIAAYGDRTLTPGRNGKAAAEMTTTNGHPTDTPTAVNELFSPPGRLKVYKDCLISGLGGQACAFVIARRDQQVPGGLPERARRGFHMIVLDVVLMALVTAAIVGFLAWSICTQYRDAGCAHLRIRRRLQVKVRLVTLDEPELGRETGIA